MLDAAPLLSSGSATATPQAVSAAVMLAEATADEKEDDLSE
jgi:hypothetical protein